MSSSFGRSLATAIALSTTVLGSGLCITAPTASATTSATASQVGARQGATRWNFSINDEFNASVDVGTGNLMVATADRSAPTIDGAASFGLAYQSLAAASGSQDTSGAAGNGWFLSAGQDTRLISADDGSVLFVASNGTQGTFTLASGSTTTYTSPAGFHDTLTKNSDSTWTMSDAPSGGTYKFNTDGRLASITDRSGQATTFAYSGGNVSSATLPTGQVITFTFSGGKLASMTRPANGSLSAGTVTYSYNSNGQLTSITRPAIDGGSASTTTMTYSGAGDLASITDPLGNVTNFSYDGVHRVTQVSQGKGSDLATTRFSYASATQTLVADPTTSQSSPVSSVAHTTYTLDSTGRVTSTTDPMGRSRSTKYTGNFDVASQSNGIGGTSSTTYGSNGTPSSAMAAMGSTNKWSYAKTTDWNPSDSTDAQGNTSTYLYDPSGRPISSQAAGTNGAKSSVTYNSDGTVASSTDPAGKTTTYTESSSGKYIAKITPPSGSALGATTITGNPATSVTNGAGQTTNYTYDDRYDLTGASTSSQSVSFTYDANGRVTSRADKNQKVTYSYDSRGNLLTISASPVSGGKAPAASTISYTYDLAGNMTSRTVNGSTTKYAYDADHELTSMTEPTGALTQFAYNNAGERTDTWWRTNAANTTFVAHTHNVYANGGNLTQTWTSTKNQDSSRMSDYSYCYQKVSSASSCNYTATTGNTGLITHIVNNISKADSSLSYDSQNRLTSATNWAGHNYTYTYDTDGNRTSTTIDGTKSQSLSFNQDNQITSSGYAYDKAGRRTSDPNAGNTTWDDMGRATGVSKGSTSGSLSYAGLGQDELLQQVTGSSTEAYIYGRSSQAGIPTEEEVTATGDSNPTIVNNDAFGKPLDFAEGQWGQFIMYDGIGNMIGAITESGANDSTYHLDPYGALLSVTSGANTAASQPKSGMATAQSMADASKQLKASGTTASMAAAAASTAASSGSGEAGWATYGIEGSVTQYWKRGARWNDTYTGTWTSVDSVTMLNNPDRANAYVYAADNPINLTDPNGAWSVDVSFKACFGICASAGLTANSNVSLHPHVGVGSGPEFGTGAEGSFSNGDASKGWSGEESCSAGPVGLNNNGEVSYKVGGETGCDVSEKYTW